MTGVEFDHADIFRDLAHVKTAFDAFIAAVPPASTLFAFDTDGNLDELLAGKRCRIDRYGRRSSSPWRLGPVDIDPPWTRFDILFQDRLYGHFKTTLPGEHNLSNILAAVAVAHELKIPAGDIAAALETFEGIRRRQEIRGFKNGITIIDDFAHHPTAVKETVRALKPFCPDGRLIAVFEPRTNSSMRDVFQDVYPESFDEADLVCIRRPPLLDKIPPGERFSAEMLVTDLKRRHIAAYFFADTDSIIDFLVATARPQDVILVMSNGGFDNIHARLLDAL